MTDSVSSHGPEQVLKIDGEWTIRRAEELHRRFTAFLASGALPVVDLGAVGGCDTATLQLILSLCKTARAREGFRIAALSPAIEEAAAALGVTPGELTAEGGSHGL